ncbi:hypothetical protein [Xanthomonas hortorum]|uniref:DUF2628 domain-containing protein n=1 Tax=Xanthomonas hortorum pv. hederae TaxID=453603 RepID=A0A9X3YY84_9XANT|nr:hypothetical protein [Xanthomonas hortorum]MCE4369830.1 hypothetical protein [Xanthomonas hortorum pv. hederae]MDC8636516.1 hypothetical protein [Xanthomonas hortorum pv. hederae]PPU85463.1 hypothetical protein XhhCFBP4925_04155 [Xanthomonas hortorum pv. hederae]PUF01831.1 hypothetical protein C7T87_00840 [Xanthomonas hortorum pv. hederae]
MFMVEPAAPKSDPARRDSAPSAPPEVAPWPAHSPLDPAVAHFRGAPCYQIWQRGADWTAVREGVHWSAGLAPRAWALRYRQWRLLALGLSIVGLAGGLAMIGAQAWVSSIAWAVMLLADALLRVRVARHAGRWRNEALQRDGWQTVTRLRAISVADALTTAQIRAGRPTR